MQRSDIPGLRVTVMGLGLHGGGLASAKFLAQNGAEVCVTDLRSEDLLAPSIRALEGLPIRFVLGTHEAEDFGTADLVIKNPAVRRQNPFLQMARRIATDISLFLELFPGPVLGITGSKGKSSTASALAHGLSRFYPGTRLGGNITRSPLTFLDEVSINADECPVVLELSSFQLGDFQLTGTKFAPRVAILTNIHRDHQDYYPDMEAYVADKELIFRGQTKGNLCILNGDQALYAKRFAKRAPEGSATWFASAKPDPPRQTRLWLDGGNAWYQAADGRSQMLFSGNLRVPGDHQRMNLLMAGGAMVAFGISPDKIHDAIVDYPGIPHRMEYCGEIDGVRIYNDSAATIPEAVAAAVESFAESVHVIAGGTNKNLDFAPFGRVADGAASISLLEGTALEGILAEIGRSGKLTGNFSSLEACLDAALSRAKQGEVVVLSPGCASFGMFLNEFDRGDRFRALVQSRTNDK